MATLKRNAYLNDEWTPQEQSILEELLAKHSSDNEMYCYAQIAMHLKDKCLLDVILRCRWMSENGMQEKYPIFRKNKDKKVKLVDLMPKLTRAICRSYPTNGPPNAQAVLPMDSDGGIYYQAIDAPIGQLLEQNAQILDQISANSDAYKIQENINLLLQAQNNIFNVANNLQLIDNGMPPQMKQMPPLPVKINEELVNLIRQQPPSL